MPTVKLPPTPLAAIQRSEESDCHSLASHAVPARRPLLVGSALPKPFPATVADTFWVPFDMMEYESSSEYDMASETLPVRSPTVIPRCKVDDTPA
eukprot:1060477-Rhodomonas_salina.1